MSTHKELLRKLNKEVATLWRLDEGNHLAVADQARKVEEIAVQIKDSAITVGLRKALAKEHTL